jgi:predicted ArsR family transcriptional regulator
LKRRGPQTSAELGAALEATDEAARQQLVKMAAEGLVEGISESGKS